MTSYFADKHYKNITYQTDDLNLKEFEGCGFTHCDFSLCNFIGLTFIDCTFTDCIFTGAKINHVSFRTVNFIGCSIEDVNFAMCDKMIFEIHFTDCRLDFSKFYALKMKDMEFVNCSMIAVDFMKTDLTNVLFDRCDLYRTLFVDSILKGADFRTSFNYELDPGKNKLRRTQFSLHGVKGLLAKHEIVIV